MGVCYVRVLFIFTFSIEEARGAFVLPYLLIVYTDLSLSASFSLISLPSPFSFEKEFDIRDLLAYARTKEGRAEFARLEEQERRDELKSAKKK